jgi:hypothetical protein
MQAKTISGVKKNFLAPPASVRPMVRWWWFGAAVEKPEILRELRQMKADGIGGAEIAFVYPVVLDDPAKGLKNLPFLSPEMLDDVSYAQAEGRKLGLRMDVTLCSGWPYGGPAITLAQAASGLHVKEVMIPANARSIALPAFAPGETLIAVSAAPGEPGHWTAASAKPLPLPLPNDTNTLLVDPVSGSRVAIIFTARPTGQVVKRAAVAAEGWVLDPFSHDAVATHLKAVGEPLVKAFGATPPYAIFSDSLEAYGADWTPNLPAEFKKRRGYDLIPHLPELVAGGTPEADKLRHDWGRTLTELVDQNYLTQINNWAIAHHTKFRSQTYGEPAVSFSSQDLAGLPEGEGPQWRSFSTLRWASSASHVFGHAVTSGETFTWLHSPVFRATPLDMKTEADMDFIMGENQLVFHGWPYSAPDGKVPEPGWSLYAAGAFNDHNPWHPVMPSVTAYITRISYLLQQGRPANQVAVLLPTDDAWAGFSPANVSITGAMPQLITPALMSAILSAGYNVDYIDADAINKVGLGSHQILVLPPTDRIPLSTLRRIRQFVAGGGRVISVGRAPSLDAEGETNAEITAWSKQLFDPAASTFVPDESKLPDALHQATAPDLQLAPGDDSVKSQLGFIRRKLADADIYFVANTSNRTLDATATFATKYRFAEQWDPDSTVSASASANAQTIHLEPYESRIFIFSDSPDSKPAVAIGPQLADLSADWQVTFTAANKSVTESTLTDWTADPATLHYSGEAVYSRDFTLAAAPAGSVFLAVEGGQPLPGSPNSQPEPQAIGANGLPNPLITRAGPGMHAYFDPPIREAALVTINGAPAGALWHPPYRLDVTKLLKPGVNHVEIHVYNTALNAWSALPPHDYQPLIAKYGDRFQMQDLNRVRPISSGILGTVQLLGSK